MLRKQLIRLFLTILSMICFALCMGAKLLFDKYGYTLFQKLYVDSYFVLLITVTVLIVEYLLANKIYKGFHYFVRYKKVMNSLKSQLIDAGLYIERGNIIELPKIKLLFDNDLSKGTLKIRNSIKFDKKLDDIVMSAALGKFIVERHYQTDDGNYYVYEIIDGSKNFKMTFNSYDEFIAYNKKIPTYSLFLDKRSNVKMQSMLLCGCTGSGKTYMAYLLILELMNKSANNHLYIADPKGSSLLVLGEKIVPENTAVKIDEIVALLERFVEKMRERKAELKELLKNRLEADYSDFGLENYTFVMEEYSAVAYALGTQEKKVRDNFKSLVAEIVLEGRQCGFNIWFLMQKSDASLIDTAFRDNLPLKVVLGNSEQQTYVTAFGAGVDIPKRHYKQGEGVFTEPQIAPEPKLVYVPYLNFDILSAIESTTPVM